MANFTKKQIETAANVAIKDAGGKKNLTLNVIALGYRGRTVADATYHYVIDGNIHAYYKDQKAYLERHKIAHTDNNFKTVYHMLFSVAIRSIIEKYMADHNYYVSRDANGNLHLFDKNGKRVR